MRGRPIIDWRAVLRYKKEIQKSCFQNSLVLGPQLLFNDRYFQQVYRPSVSKNPERAYGGMIFQRKCTDVRRSHCWHFNSNHSNALNLQLLHSLQPLTPGTIRTHVPAVSGPMSTKECHTVTPAELQCADNGKFAENKLRILGLPIYLDTSLSAPRGRTR